MDRWTMMVARMMAPAIPLLACAILLALLLSDFAENPFLAQLAPAVLWLPDVFFAAACGWALWIASALANGAQ